MPLNTGQSPSTSRLAMQNDIDQSQFSPSASNPGKRSDREQFPASIKQFSIAECEVGENQLAMKDGARRTPIDKFHY